MAIDVGTGTTISIPLAGFIAKVLDISGEGIERESFRTSDQTTTGYHTHIPGKLIEGGTIRVNFLFDEDALTPTTLPPIGAAAEVVTINFPDADSVSGMMYVESWNWAAPFEGLKTADMVLKVAGDLTWA